MGQIFQVKVHVAVESTDGQEECPLRFQASDRSYFLSGAELKRARALGSVLEVVRQIDEDELPVRFLLPHDGAVNDPPPESARLAVLSRLLSEGRAAGEVHIRFLGRHRTVPPDGFVLDQAGGERRYVWQVVPAREPASRPELRQRFVALRREFARPDTRAVLSLGSGGLKLFGHAAALRLLESVGCAPHIEEVWGASAGALVALLYCHGLSPHAIEQTGYDLYSGRYDLALRPSKFQILRELLREAILPTDRSAPGGFVDCAEGLSRMLDQYCDVIRPIRPFYCVAYNLAESRPEVLTPEPVPDHLRGFAAQTEPREAALASSAVPLLFVPKTIEREGQSIPYIDGSTTEDVPLHSVVRKWDLDREAGVETRDRLIILYVRLTGAAPQARTDGGRMSKLRVLQAVASAGMETMYNRDVDLIEQRSDVTLLRLQLVDSAADFFETQRIPEFIRAAKETFPEQLAAIEEKLRAG